MKLPVKGVEDRIDPVMTKVDAAGDGNWHVSRTYTVSGADCALDAVSAIETAKWDDAPLEVFKSKYERPKPDRDDYLQPSIDKEPERRVKRGADIRKREPEKASVGSRVAWWMFHTLLGSAVGTAIIGWIQGWFSA